MDRKDGREPCASELFSDSNNPGIVGRFANKPAEIRCVKLPILARSSRNQPLQFLFLKGCRALRLYVHSAFHFRFWQGAPPPHEAQKKPSGHSCIPARSVERKEALPDDLRIDVPAGERRFRSLDQIRPRCAINVAPCINVDPACKDSFVLRVSR